MGRGGGRRCSQPAMLIIALPLSMEVATYTVRPSTGLKTHQRCQLNICDVLITPMHIFEVGWGRTVRMMLPFLPLLRDRPASADLHRRGIICLLLRDGRTSVDLHCHRKPKVEEEVNQ